MTARYSSRPFPPYRYLPGLSKSLSGDTPHPERHPQGHLHLQPLPPSVRLERDHWRTNETYLYAVDLFNAGYWWEAHEAFERLWRLADSEASSRLLLQGLIQLAAAALKWRCQQSRGVSKLASSALSKLSRVRALEGDRFMGLGVSTLIEATRTWAAAPAGIQMLVIELHSSGRENRL